MKTISKLFSVLLCLVLAASILVVTPRPALAASQNPNYAWQKVYGGSGHDYAATIKNTSDGGFILAGMTDSRDGDVKGYHAGKDSDGYSTSDAWIFKVSASGKLLWQKCIGGSKEDRAASAIQTADGGYLVFGNGDSTDGDFAGLGKGDLWLAKLDSKGKTLWLKRYDLSSGDDSGVEVLQAVGGTYFIVANSETDSGNDDIYIAKLTAEGKLVWNKKYGGSARDTAYSARLTDDGGLVISADTDSKNGNVSGNHGGVDAWFFKVNADGKLDWQKCFGAKEGDMSGGIAPVADGYVAAYLYWGPDSYTGRICKLSKTGAVQWTKDVPDTAVIDDFTVTADGGYAFMEGGGEGMERDFCFDFYKLDKQAKVAGTVSFWQTEGTSGFAETADGGFAVAGSPYSDARDYDVLVAQLKPVVALKKMSINAKNIYLQAGKTVPAPGLILTPADATTPRLYWESSNDNVAWVRDDVDAQGNWTYYIKGGGVGTATLTAESQYGGFTAQCKVTVGTAPVTPVGISCQKTDATLYGAANGTITLAASGGNSGKYNYSIDGGATWKNAAVFKNVKAGKYRAAVRDASNQINVKYAYVTVGQPKLAGTYRADKIPATAKAGTAIVVTPPSAPSGYTLKSVKYSANNNSVAFIDKNGNVTFLKAGKVTLTIKAEFAKGSAKKTTTITKAVKVT